MTVSRLFACIGPVNEMMQNPFLRTRTTASLGEGGGPAASHPGPGWAAPGRVGSGSRTSAIAKAGPRALPEMNAEVVAHGGSTGAAWTAGAGDLL
jgi:hypothetical protein